ncbi:MAG: ATP-grasp domain-containing protein [Saprospiraceae bacterium]|nr:ATP-grasp domain-containing protein [Saprospiraceae bacterium]
MNQTIVILTNEVKSDLPDVVDVLEQRDLVLTACLALGYEVICLELGDNLKTDFEKVAAAQPDIVFSLVEDIWGKGELLYFAPAILTAHRIAYTGNPLEALFLTADKVLTKKLLRLHDLPTADFFDLKSLDTLDPTKTYIVKPKREDASIGIDASAVFNISETLKVEKIRRLPPPQYFIEEYIDGREFNLSLLVNDGKVDILPMAEIEFLPYFADKPKILDYDAKWNETSAGYKNTIRSFGTLEDKPHLKQALTQICEKVWQVFDLKGYARIDFRIDEHDSIYILEINANPCISADSGFAAAVQQAGYSYIEMIQRILSDLNQ